jgi:hypothetical protein
MEILNWERKVREDTLPSTFSIDSDSTGMRQQVEKSGTMSSILILLLNDFPSICALIQSKNGTTCITLSTIQKEKK